MLDCDVCDDDRGMKSDREPGIEKGEVPRTFAFMCACKLDCELIEEGPMSSC